MPAILELLQTSGVVSRQLIDLLHVVPEDAHVLTWAILDLEAIGDIGEVWDAGVVDLETQLHRSAVIFDWQDLVKLANSFEQVINITLVACLNTTDIPSVDFEVDKSNCEFVLELVDSTVWRIYAKHQDNLQRFLNPQLQSVA